MNHSTCIFCQIINKEISADIFFEDEELIAFLDIDPINKGHLLIVPKIHILDLDELNEKQLFHLMNITKSLLINLKKEYSIDGYSIMQNGGNFNDIGHFHLHLLPRYINDGFGWKYKN
ncbi:HIT family protein [Empedobacter brevis]|uniref:HIT family protein n=1 Tax=Empedobacter brevis TaxID=247 RepID=UPI0028A8766B|nr:HIT family protein [Empedobacter brevis]